MPREYVNGVKQGFSGPDGSWFKGDSLEYVRHFVLNNSAHLYDFLRKDTVEQLIKQHMRGDANRRLFIWSLLNFEWWLRKFLRVDNAN